MKTFNFFSIFNELQSEYCKYMLSSDYQVSTEPVDEFCVDDEYSVKYFKFKDNFEVRLKTKSYSYEIVMDDINKIKMLYLKYGKISIRASKDIKAIKDDYGKYNKCHYLRVSYDDGVNNTQIETPLMNEISLCKVIDTLIAMNNDRGDYFDPIISMCYIVNGDK